MAEKASMKVVPPGKKKCIWMEAGVVSYKLCDNNYDCSTCAYDHAMDAKAARKKEAPAETGSEQADRTWVEMMMMLPASQRKCRYMLTEEIGRKLCPNAYECGTCAFDQMMQERLRTESLPIPAPEKVVGFELADGFYYHDGHTWARPEYGGRIRIGLDDFAQKLLGSKSRISLPEIGCEVTQGGTGFTLKREGQEIPVLSPADGVVTHVNPALTDHPELINTSPYDKGWLFTIEPTRLRKNLKALYFGEDARNFINQAWEKLLSMADEGMGLSKGGGETIGDIFDSLEENRWADLVKTFLMAS